ncbi:MAG: hypothetical protein WBO46_02745 [Caldilineaceae bacterium]
MAITRVSREDLRVEKPRIAFKENVVLKDHLVQRTEGGRTVHEFIGTDNFAAAFAQRQQYEVDAGRSEEPILYTPIYQTIEDRNLPEIVPVNRLGPAGVVFQRITEGGEVKFATVGESNFSVPIYHHAVGLEYTDDLVEYNKLFTVTEVEREMGVAYNALLNDLHFAPFLEYSYGAANAIDGGGLGVYGATDTLPEMYLRTLEAAITESVGDTTNPRRGPYVLLISTANLFTVERALTIVPQQGITLQSSALSRISTVIAYDGWTGSMGSLDFSYSGVASGKAYLIDVGRRARNHRSYIKHGLLRVQGNPDVSRFILEQTVWHSRLGVYADPIASTEEITLPELSDRPS